MPGLFSQIASALTGGDTKLIGRIEEFAVGFVTQGEVGRALGLSREEVGLLDNLLAEELYRSYCASRGRECDSEIIARLTAERKARESRVQISGEALGRLESALRVVAVDLTNLARQRGKFTTGFTSVDGLTESLVADAIALHVMDVKAAKRAAID